jgi:hypothetical protein
MIDCGSEPVLMEASFADSLSLCRHKLRKPLPVDVAFLPSSNKHTILELTEWVKLKVSDPTRQWTSRTVKALVAPKPCYPVL